MIEQMRHRGMDQANEWSLNVHRRLSFIAVPNVRRVATRVLVDGCCYLFLFHPSSFFSLGAARWLRLLLFVNGQPCERKIDGKLGRGLTTYRLDGCSTDCDHDVLRPHLSLSARKQLAKVPLYQFRLAKVAKSKRRSSATEEH